MNIPAWANIAYLVASVLFIFGIKGMTHPRTAVRGNLMSAMAMLIAVVVTLMLGGLEYWVIVAGLVVGAGVGAFLAVKVEMTGMPQLVAAFNGFGGGASTFVAWAELIANPRRVKAFQTDHAEALAHSVGHADEVELIRFKAEQAGLALTSGAAEGVLVPTPEPFALIAAALAGLIGTVTLTGSFVAYGKLEGLKKIEGNVALPLHQLLNAALLLGAIALGAWIVMAPGAAPWAYLLLALVAAVLGVTLVLPIGGADMPVVVSLLNSYSGLAAAMTGFVLSNNMLIIAGSLVGAAGLILTAIMCKAMNRSLVNVVFGKIDASTAVSADEVYEGKIKSTSAEELAMMLDGVQRVVVVPGYGMAVAQAQHAVRDLYNLLEDQGVTVEFAIHPVAGRMPGHMNVLLAEVDIPYDKLIESDVINGQMDQVDVAIVLGANDVVNPDARKQDSPIAGMPIVDVDKARTVVVVKRSLSPGFAGIPNPLFAMDNALMYFGDGKKAMTDLITAIKEN